MNKGTFIGNLTRDPELRTTTSGVNVCTFTIAVNGKKKDDPADFFKITAWRGLADICSKFLSKGSKVCVIGAVHLNTYTANDGSSKSNLEVTADDIEFLNKVEKDATAQPTDSQSGFADVSADVGDDLPF